VRLWLGSIVASAVVAIWMIEFSISVVGVWRALMVNFVLFSAAIVLMLLIARRRSNIARWLLAVPFNLLILISTSRCNATGWGSSRCCDSA
jgi:hypothetical protein